METINHEFEIEIPHEDYEKMTVKIDNLRGQSKIDLRLDTNRRVYMTLAEFDHVSEIVRRYRNAQVILDGSNATD